MIGGPAGLTASVFERIASLDGTNYRSWAFSMKMLLKAHELWEVIEYDEDEGAGMSEQTAEGSISAVSGPKSKRTDTKAWQRKDQLVLSNIALAVKSSEQGHIYRCTTAKEAWNALKELYEGQGMHRFLSLLKSISTAKFEPGEKPKIKDYVHEVWEIADQLSEMGCKFGRSAVVGFILNGLPDNYRYLVVNLESQIRTIGYEDLSARLVDEEKRKLQMVQSATNGNHGNHDVAAAATDPDTVQAHMARMNRNLRCRRCNETRHLARNCPNGNDIMECEYCGGKGHLERTCRVKDFRLNRMGQGQKSRAYIAQHNDNSDGYETAYSSVFHG